MIGRGTVCSDGHSDAAHARLIAEHLVDGVTATRMAELFKAMADPTRVRIISLLAHAEVCVGDLCLALGMSQPAVSHHLKLLRLLRIVRTRKEGQHVYYALLDDHVHTLFQQAYAHVEHEDKQETP
jgi:ArsR family transcriptional regulator